MKWGKFNKWKYFQKDYVGGVKTEKIKQTNLPFVSFLTCFLQFLLHRLILSLLAIVIRQDTPMYLTLTCSYKTTNFIRLSQWLRLYSVDGE